MKKRIITAIAALLALLLIFAAADFSGMIKGRSVTVKVESGEGLSSVAKKMRQSGVVFSSRLFETYAVLKGADASVQAGSHRMNKHMGFKNAVESLISPGINDGTVRLTVPEGFEIYRLADKVNEVFGIGADDFYAAEKLDYDIIFTKEIPNRENRYEGYLFPDTYEFDASATGEDITKRMLLRFSEIWTDEYKNRAKELGMTMDEVVILASIIEREAGNEGEMGKVSSVFHNRLNIDMPLQSCATVQYILKERKSVLSVEDTKIDSPYNTYMYKGLPKGPIASPGKAAINAALYPETTDYLYFKVTSDGVTVFSKTLEEHNSK